MDDNSDIEDEESWLDELARAFALFIDYYCTYICKEPCYSFENRWIRELLNGHEDRCFRMFRMNADAFCSLCVKMEIKYGLQSSKRASVQEKVAIFSYVVGQITSNKHTCERFLHLGKMISRYFDERYD